MKGASLPGVLLVTQESPCTEVTARPGKRRRASHTCTDGRTVVIVGFYQFVDMARVRTDPVVIDHVCLEA